MKIQLKKLTEKSELQAMERLEAAVWSEASMIPLHMTLTIGKFGGLFLGAFDKDEMIGFLYSFPGFTDGQFHLCSHMLGFLPAYRKAGLGVKMKWLQREEALRMGYTKITWTYDPLETVNAYLNIAKLGGIVRRYLPNCYGEMQDEMNKGLPTDRFLVEWFIDSKRVKAYQNGSAERRAFTDSIPSVLSYTLTADGVPVPDQSSYDRKEELLALSVPAFFQEVKRTDMGIAAAWRSATRELFQHYFVQGYVVTDVIRHDSQPIVTYLFHKGADLA